MYNAIKRFFSHDIVQILSLFMASRVALALIGMCARIVFSGEKPWNYINILWLDIWGVWDTGWYLNIAENGYSSLPQNPEGQHTYAFFPLYPYLVRAVSVITQNTFVSGIIVSNICLIVACVFLYKLIRIDADNDTAHRAVKYLVLFPVAFVFSGIFTESLFLMLLVLSFYFGRKEQWLFAGISGFFLALTRSIGVFAIIPLGLMYLYQRKFSLKSVTPQVLWLLAIPLGLVTFMVFNYYLTGDPLAFVHVQSEWGRQFLGPWAAFAQGWNSGDFSMQFECIFTVIVSIFLITSFKKIPFHYFVLSAYSILIPLSTSVMSMPRYTLVIFPLFILLAQYTKKPVYDMWLTVMFAMLQGSFMVYWTLANRLIV